MLGELWAMGDENAVLRRHAYLEDKLVQADRDRANEDAVELLNGRRAGRGVSWTARIVRTMRSE